MAVLKKVVCIMNSYALLKFVVSFKYQHLLDLGRLNSLLVILSDFVSVENSYL